VDCGLIGLSGSGKTALFRALVGPGAAIAPGGGRPNVGVASVPDPRLEILARHVESRKVTPATLRLVDVPGIDVGTASHPKTAGALAAARGVEALCHVVRCFEAPGLPGPRCDDPVTDIAALEDEMILADLALVEGALEKAARAARSGDADAKARHAVLDRLAPALGEGRPALSVGPWTASDEAILRSYALLSAKRCLYVANVAEEDLAGSSTAARAVLARAAESGGEAVAVCARLEAELAELPETDRAEMLAGLGLGEPAIGTLATALYRLLRLVVFYTANPREIRAWPVPADATAVEAAGVVHSDMQRGFIRAECYGIQDLEALGSEKAIRSAGRLRVEGKSYRVHDGDVIHFLFSV
jgi:hypothetical protein